MPSLCNESFRHDAAGVPLSEDRGGMAPDEERRIDPRDGHGSLKRECVVEVPSVPRS